MLVWYAVSTLFYSPVLSTPFDIEHSVFLQLFVNSIVLLGVRALLHHRILFKVPVVVSPRMNSALNSVMFSLSLLWLRYLRQD